MSALVSIVLPVYNGEKYLEESIKSIIAQTYCDWELIVVDDGSTDNSSSIAQKYANCDKRIHYFKNEKNLKLPRSLNKGFSLSKGEYLTWTSDDNRYLPDALEEMVNALEQNDVEFVFADCDIIDENGKVIEVFKIPQDFRDSIHVVNHIGACFLYTRKVYNAVGEYNPNKFLVEDYDYWLRIITEFPYTNIDKILYQYRFHSGALTSTEKNEKINKMREGVILDHIASFGNLNWKQKYYFYNTLYNLNKSYSVRTKDKYKFKAQLYKIWYDCVVKIPGRIKRYIVKL